MIHIVTDRQKEVIDKLSEGRSNEQIGQDLFICEKTVKYHLGIIYKNLDKALNGKSYHALIDRRKQLIAMNKNSLILSPKNLEPKKQPTERSFSEPLLAKGLMQY